MPDEWETFYLMSGSSAAALIGLLFVVVTLTPEQRPDRMEAGSRIYTTPIVYSFGAIVLISSFAIMPEGARPIMPLVVGLPSLAGLVYAALSLYRLAWQAPNPPHWTDYIYYAALPLLGYLGLLVSAIGLWLRLEFAPYLLAIAITGLLLLGIRDAWDLATFLARTRGR